MGGSSERAAGLPCPRPPAEQVGKRVLLSDGTDVTCAFARGAQVAREAVVSSGAPLAVLKAKSPSCGVGLVYDGSYTGTLTAGMGVCARLLTKEGICVVTEDTVKNIKPSVEHPVAIVLGTGLGHLKNLVKPVRHIDYHDIEGFPADAMPIEGHNFEALVGTVDEVPVVVYPGRIHLYQGYSAAEVTALVRHASHLGCRDIIFACATGSVPPPGNGTGGIASAGCEASCSAGRSSCCAADCSSGCSADCGASCDVGVSTAVESPEKSPEIRACPASGCTGTETNGLPQFVQNFDSGAFFEPHCVQNMASPLLQFLL